MTTREGVVPGMFGVGVRRGFEALRATRGIPARLAGQYRRALVVAVALLTSSACTSASVVATRFAESLTPTELPRVVACYERAFEDANFTGEFELVADFRVAAESGAVSGVVVRDAISTSGPAVPADFVSCVKLALEGSSLAASAHAIDGGVEVVGLRLVFRDASASLRREATVAHGNMLLGPRADRCAGLYRYEPPRDAALLYGELDEAQRRAKKFGERDADGAARSLQRAFDAALELRERLRRDAAIDGLSTDNRARLRDATGRAERSLSEIGSAIGCSVPR